MKNKFMKKTLAVALAASVLAPANFIHAAQFKDVTANHWAYKFIEEMSNQNVIKGYVDGTYKPEKEVQFLEVLNLIKGVMDLDAGEMSAARTQYGAAVKDLQVPEWAEDAVLAALQKNVLSLDKLKEAKKAGMVSYNPTRIPDRSSVAVYYARALGLEKKKDFSKLKHSDLGTIDTEVKEYLAALVDAGIFEATGADGKFDGPRGIRRDEMAKITNLSYDYNKTAKTYKGTVYFVSSAVGVNEFLVDNGKEKKAFNTNSSTEFSLNGKKAEVKDLATGLEVTVTYKEVDTNLQPTGRLATKVDLKKTDSSVYGRFYNLDGNDLSLICADKKEDVDFRTGKIEKGSIKKFTIPKDAKVTGYGDIIIKLTDIRDRDLVEVKSVNNEIKEVKVYPENGGVEGTVTKVERLNSTSTVRKITLKLLDQTEDTFYLESKSIPLPSVGQRVTYGLNYKTITRGSAEKNGEYIGQIIDYKPSSYYKDGYGRIDLSLTDGSILDLVLNKDSQWFEHEDINSGEWVSLPAIKDRSIINRYAKVRIEDGRVKVVGLIKQKIERFDGIVTVTDIKENPFDGFNGEYIIVKTKESPSRELRFPIYENISSIRPVKGNQYRLQCLVTENNKIADIQMQDFVGIDK